MIRKFNEYYSDSLYKQIDEDKYDEITRSDFDKVDWSEYEKDFILRLLKDKKIYSRCFSGNVKVHDIYFIYSHCGFVINKYQDDWFMVRIVLNESPFTNSYFKCDQIDGLREFLVSYFDFEEWIHNNV